MSRLPALAVALAALAALPALSGTAATAAEQVVSVPVSFDVANQNRSAVNCPADGGEYTVRGHLTGPVSALKGDTVEAATLYLHGNGVDERLWRYTGAKGYNHVAEMARQGFVSVTITRLGYQGSGTPHGMDICFGSEADIAHQIIEALRAGDYGSDGAGPAIKRLALAGHSAAGFVAMAEAYSFRDIDALMVVASGEFATPRVATAVAGQQSRCLTSEDGYELIEIDDGAAAADFFVNGEAAIVEDVIGSRPADACGPTAFAPTSIAADVAMLGTVDVPVLVIAGAQDAFFPDPDAQASLFTGSSDVQAVKLDDTGHAITLERTAPAFRAAVADWLGERGFAAQ